MKVRCLGRQVGIYKITCIPTCKIYIGESGAVYNRLCNHKTRLRNGSHPNSALLNDFKVYGEDAFRFEVLALCITRDESMNLERRLIRQYKEAGPVYNFVTPSYRIDVKESEIPDKTYINARTVTRLLQVSYPYLYNLIATQSFPKPYNVGKKQSIFKRQEVAEWLACEKMSVEAIKSQAKQFEMNSRLIFANKPAREQTGLTPR